MGTPLRVLHVEDSASDAELVVVELANAGYDIAYERVQTAEDLTSVFARQEWDVVLCDFNLPGFNAMEALAIVQATGRDVPFVIVSGTIGEDAAVVALKAGAHDFMAKDRLRRLGSAIERERRDVAARRERRQLEDQLRQAQKMEAIGVLAGGVAHDFNNMLTAILGYTELLTEQIGPDKPVGSDLREIEGAARRAVELTRQLLAFSRKQVLNVTPLDLTAVVRTLEPMLRRLLGERVTIQTTLEDDLSPVLADRNQLEHILVNLAVNARDAMPDGGVLAMATGQAVFDSAYVAGHPGARVGGYSWMSVSDTGTGISPELQSKIFEPFFTTKEHGKGTGLGLAAVYGTIKQLHGYIDLTTAIGKGTTFTIYIPVTEQPVPKAQQAVSSGTSVGNETILLVEDEPSVRAFIAKALQRFGYRVIQAETAERALQLVTPEAGRFDLLLTDIVLPGMDGLELAGVLQQRDPALRVLCMSGYSEKLVDTNILSERLSFLEKPFSPKVLLTRVRQLLGSPDALDPR